MEYSADIHKVVIGYSYVSGMYRVCIGYVSEFSAKLRLFFHICKFLVEKVGKVLEI